jgi:hypothetical protein
MQQEIASGSLHRTALPDIVIVIAVSAAAFIAELWAREAGFITLGDDMLQPDARRTPAVRDPNLPRDRATSRALRRYPAAAAIRR